MLVMNLRKIKSKDQERILEYFQQAFSLTPKEIFLTWKEENKKFQLKDDTSVSVTSKNFDFKTDLFSEVLRKTDSSSDVSAFCFVFYSQTLTVMTD